MEIEAFERLPILGILRGGDAECISALIDTVIEAGLRSLEITLNTPNAFELIGRARERAAGRLMLGAGTALTAADVARAVDAGATFIVSPTLVPEVAAACRDRALPNFPGALTPTEIYAAWRAGATMVKVFPAKAFGPGYFSEVRGPFDGIKLLACGGVSPANVGTYFEHGAAAVAFGGSVFTGDRLARRDFHAIGADIRKMIEAYHQARPAV